MSTEDEDAVRGSGTAHLVAVSGMHVAINCYLLIVMMTWLLSKWTWLAERWSVRRLVCAAGIPGALVYAAIAGGSPAAFRAALGASLGWIAFCAGRDFCAQKASTVASLLLISLQPALIFDVGFLLSILATNSLLDLKSQDLKAQSNLNDSRSSSLSNLWTVTWRPFVATLPLIVWVFGRSSPFALVANLALVPLVGGALVPLGSLHALVGPIPLLGHASAALFSVAGRAYLYSASVFSENAARVTWAGEGTAGLVILWVWSLVFLKTNDVASRVWASLFAVALTLIVGFAAEPNHRTARITFLDIGQGDASIVEFPDGHVLVIDTGPGTLTPAAGTQRLRNVVSGRSAALAAFLGSRRVSRIHDVLITHPHPDHYGGLIGLRVPWNRLIDNGQASGEQTHPLYRSLIAHRHVVSPSIVFSCERAVRYHGAIARLLAPCPRYDSGLDENDNSIVLELSIQGTRILFSGDVEQRAEAQLEDRLRPVDVLKVPHHGSSTSSTAAFVERVQPSYAIVSSELSNRYGHPSASVIERLAQYGSVLRTDLCGTIEVTFSPLRVAPTHQAACVWNTPTHSIRSNIP